MRVVAGSSPSHDIEKSFKMLLMLRAGLYKVELGLSVWCNDNVTRSCLISGA